MPLFHLGFQMSDRSAWFGLGTLVLVLAWMAPGHYVPWSSFQQQALFAAGALFVGLAAFRSSLGSVIVPGPAIAMSLLAMVPLIQHAVGLVEFRSDAVLSATFLLATALAVTVAFRLTCCSTAGFLDRLLATLLIAAMASTAIALWQWLRLPESAWIAELPPGGSPFGNVAQPNHLATLIAMGIMAIGYFFEKCRISKATAGLLLIVLGWGLVMTQSRTGWLFVALFVVWFITHRRRLALRTAPSVVAGAVVLFTVGVWSWAPLNDTLLLTSPAPIEDRMTTGLRPLHWQTLWDAALRSPWIGYGWGQVVLAQQAAALDHPPSGEWLQQSHNHALDLLIYNGLPLGVIILGGIVWWLIRQLRACRSIEQWVLLGALGAMLLHAMVEFPFDYLYFALSAGFMVGALEALAPVARRAVVAPGWSFALTLVLAFVMLSWVTLEYLKVESATRQLRFVMLRIGLDKVPEAPVPEVWLLDQPRDFHRFLLTPARRNMTLDELEEFRRNVERQPGAPAMLRYALAAGLNNRPEEAERILGLLCRMHPPKRCSEGRDSWRIATSEYPELRAIAFPAITEMRSRSSDARRSTSAALPTAASSPELAGPAGDGVSLLHAQQATVGQEARDAPGVP